MATATIKITSYSTVKLTYKIENVSNTATRLTITGYTFTNTRTDGITAKCWLDISGSVVWPDSYDSSYPAGSTVITLAKGTKSKSGNITRWYQWNRETYADSHTMYLDAELYNTDTDQSWSNWATVSVSIPAKPSYAVTFDANGGSGGPVGTTKWYGETCKLPTAEPTWSGHVFKGWGTSKTTQNVSYAPGASYTANAAVTLYAIWECAILYNANGGDGAPGSQTKYAYTNTNLSNDTPTRAGYDFKGWATSSGGDVAYQPGALYTSSDGATLYAVWAVTPPTVTATVQRAAYDDARQAYVPSLVGTYALVTVTYSLSSVTQLDAVSCSVGGESATLVSSGGTTAVYASASQYGLTEQPTVEVSVSDAASNVMTKTLQLPTAAPPIHFKPGGGGVGIGVPSVKDGFAVSMGAFFQCWAGVIQMFAGSKPPAGWLLCDGAAVSRTEYAVLFDAIGTTWGAGDGSTTFNLPDLRGRAAIGAGTGSGLSARTLGQVLGVQDAVVPYHRHTMGAHTHTNPGDSYLTNPETVARRTVASGSGATNHLYSAGATSRASNTGAMNGTPYTGYEGTSGNATGANMQPSAVVNFIIHTGKTD